MAPIHGPLMVPEALRVIKFVYSRARGLLQTKAPSLPQTTVSLNTVRTYAQKPIAVHPSALLKQSKSTHVHENATRGHSSASKPATKTSYVPRYDRSSFPSSRTSRAITQKGAAPFASTLRPNLTGGTLSRSAGGYSPGGAGKRQFSHTAGCQAQVIQNVSAGIRAFLVNGSKARYDGVDSKNGEKRWKTITKAQDDVYQKWESSTAQYTSKPKGTSLEFQLSPTITALLPLKSSESASPALVASAVEEKATSLNSDMLHTLSSDFARAFRDLAIISRDLDKLSSFGDLPISLENTARGPILTVRFPGCDASAVSALCDEAGIRRGLIVEDPAWSESHEVEMALLFPFAPADGSEADQEEIPHFFGTRASINRQQQQNRWQNRERSKTRSFSTTSLYDLSPSLGSNLSTLHFEELATPSHSDDFEEIPSEIYVEEESSSPLSHSHRSHSHHAQSEVAREEDFEGVEGIYRFLSAIENGPRR